MTQIIDYTEVRPGDRVRASRMKSDIEYAETFTVKSREGRTFFTQGGATAYVGAKSTLELLERPRPAFKVGDRVRRPNPQGVSIEFDVHLVEHGRIYPRYGASPKDRVSGVGYDPDGFELVE